MQTRLLSGVLKTSCCVVLRMSLYCLRDIDCAEGWSLFLKEEEGDELNSPRSFNQQGSCSQLEPQGSQNQTGHIHVICQTANSDFRRGAQGRSAQP